MQPLGGGRTSKHDVCLGSWHIRVTRLSFLEKDIGCCIFMKYSSIYIFPSLYYHNRLSPSTLGTVRVVMITIPQTLDGFTICLEWFLFGDISVLCCMLVAKEVQLFPGLGVYSGILAIHLQFRKANIVSYILCLLYVLCAVTVVCDLLNFTFTVSSNPMICRNILFIISCAVACHHLHAAIASTSNRLGLTVNIKPHFVCPTHSKYLL